MKSKFERELIWAHALVFCTKRKYGKTQDLGGEGGLLSILPLAWLAGCGARGGLAVWAMTVVMATGPCKILNRGPCGWGGRSVCAGRGPLCSGLLWLSPEPNGADTADTAAWGCGSSPSPARFSATAC